jgi:hypothetical protein
MPDSSGNGVSTREHIETILGKVEATIQREVSDIKHNYVQRAEYQTAITNLYRDLDRVERDHAERFTELRGDIKSARDEIRNDVVSENRKNLTLIGIGIGLIELVIKVFTK